MENGQHNLLAGFAFLAAFMAYGFVLIYLRDFAPDKAAWIAAYASGKHFESRLAHVHGNLFAELNVLIGLVLPRLDVPGKVRRVVAWLGLAGMLMPLGIFLEVYFGAPPLLVLLGGVSMLAAMVVLSACIARHGLVKRESRGAGTSLAEGDRMAPR